MRCRVKITADTVQAHHHGAGGPGRLSGGHLLDQPYRKTSVQAWMIDLQQQPRRRTVSRVHDHEYRAHLFGGRSRIAFRRLDHLEDIAESDAVATAFVDKE